MTVMVPGWENDDARPPLIDTLHSSLYGGAIGDALGFPHEFNQETDGGQENILRLEHGATVSDDTQLACATADATARIAQQATSRKVTAKDIVASFRREFVAWRRDSETPDGAPGRTCLTAASRLADGASVPEAAQWGSKGNGAVMRMHPIGFLEAQTPDSRLRTRVALISGGMTHSHPASVVACLIWTELISAVARGAPTASLGDIATNVLDTCLNGWRTELLSQWSEAQRPVDDDREGSDMNHLIHNPRAWIEHGVRECGEALERSATLLEDYLGDDPCETFGQGWTAPEALAVSFSVASYFAKSPWAGVERSARSCGDSDTVASMVGSLLGASVGTAYWEDLPDRLPPRWSGKIRSISF